MRLPAVALAVAFAGGILLGRQIPLGFLIAQRLTLTLFLGIIFLLLLAALLFAWRGRLGPAIRLSLLCWTGLGELALTIASQPLPPEHILNRIAADQLDLKTPLRWYGHLRSDPARLPWGYGVELELAYVETAQGPIPASGGMRLEFTPEEGEPALPELHAGDGVGVLAQAQRPWVFRDAGAFDRRAYLASQDVHLLATLRSSSLLERASSPTPILATRVARLRAQLRERLDALYPTAPQTAAILRAKLLGDRSFADRDESAAFQKTGVFHVLVVAGLNVGVLAFFIYWLGKRLRLLNTIVTSFGGIAVRNAANDGPGLSPRNASRAVSQSFRSASYGSDCSTRILHSGGSNAVAIIRARAGCAIRLAGLAARTHRWLVCELCPRQLPHPRSSRLGDRIAGSKNSTMPEFLEQVRPQLAVISADEENPYGYPSPELLERLRANGVRTLRTDQSGAVQLLTDGHILRANCFVACPEEIAASGNVHAPDHQ